MYSRNSHWFWIRILSMNVGIARDTIFVCAKCSSSIVETYLHPGDGTCPFAFAMQQSPYSRKRVSNPRANPPPSTSILLDMTTSQARGSRLARRCQSPNPRASLVALSAAAASALDAALPLHNPIRPRAGQITRPGQADDDKSRGCPADHQLRGREVIGRSWRW